MQFLGYRHVVATLWTIADLPSPKVADICYTALTVNGQPDPGRSAEALHRAVCFLRQKDPANPPLWAPYVYFGS
jgi:CHAT domain-containing protein